MTGWREVTVGDVAEYVNGLAFKPSDWVEQGRPIIRIQNLTNPLAPFNRTVRSVEERYIVRSGDILVSWSATLDAFRWAGPEAVLNQHIFRVIPRIDLVDPTFLFLGLKVAISEMVRSEHLHGSTMKHINRGPFLAHPFRVPPLDVQRRIVAKLDALLAQSREAREQLEAVPDLVETYRQSVLAAAFRGDLTADWRKKNPDVEPASKLLERIRVERRKAWEAAELAKMTAKGKPPKDDKWKSKYAEPEPVDTTDLPELPPTWCWARMDQLVDGENGIFAGPFGTIFKAKDFRPSGVPIIFLRHVARGRYLTRKPGFMDEGVWRERFRECSVVGGELLVTKLGEPPGVAAIYPTGIGPAMVTPDVIAMHVAPQRAVTLFLMHYLNSDAARRVAFGLAFGSTRLRLTLPIFRGLAVPLPPLAEQRVIVGVVDAALARAEQAGEASVGLEQAFDDLQGALLAKAFSGELVPG